MIIRDNFLRKATTFIIAFFALTVFYTTAQNEIIVRGKVTSATDGEELISVTVSEIDKNNRVIGGTLTNLEGDYVIKVKSEDSKLTFNYIGFSKREVKVGKQRTINMSLKEENQLTEVIVTARQTTNTGSMNIPTREISTAMQKINTKEFEGIQVSSIEDALQGRISGLDIVSNSSSPGSGMSMRIRGTSTINNNAQPLIVVNGVPYETTISNDFDFTAAREEQYADLLNVNPDDILEIVVLKDAASTAIWGSRGANGVLQITTKKGARGKPRIQYSYRVTTAWMPEGIPLLNGDEYTMMMKEAMLNSKLRPGDSDIPEYSYINDGTAFYWNYNNNTDWVDEIKQTSWKHDHNVSIAGGGERGDYRISFGYLTEDGIIKGQGLNRFTNRSNIRYKMSDRLYFTTEVAYTYSDNDRNYVYDGKEVLDYALRKMPNVPVYARDENGNSTGAYFNIDRSNSNLLAAQRDMINPVALVNLAKYNVKTYRVVPDFELQFDILDPEKSLLRFRSKVSIDVNTVKTTAFLPKEVSGAHYTATEINSSTTGDDTSNNINLNNNITWQPRLPEGHSFMLYGSVQTYIGKGYSQSFKSNRAPSSNMESVGGGFLEESKSYSWESRNYGIVATAHYAYKEKYIIDPVLRRDVSSRFGKGNRVAYFPGVSAKWIISDEKFMDSFKFLDMLAIRPSWGVSGNAPSSDYLYFSKYQYYDGNYMDMPAIYQSNVQLNNLKWEKTTQYNLGFDLELFGGKIIADANVYHKRTEDLLFKNIKIPTSTGFSTLAYMNVGTMDNDGWEFNMRAPNFIKAGDFSMDFNFNLSNYKNRIQELSDKIDLTSGNMLNNGDYLRKIVIGNALGSFYGYRYKGVYQYNDYIEGVQENAPVARDANGNVIYDKYGKPKPMMFNYAGSTEYEFKGGDAIYEDINNDGVINELDVVYLGNANPLLNGGFGFMLKYKNLSVNTFFHFRYGNDIVNQARMYLENMHGSDNQSKAVNWRWRKDGDVTDMPRALYNVGYNWLGSDRYVEDGSFLRFKYLTVNYAAPKAWIKRFGLTDLKFYCTMNNIAIWTNYTGVDPEIGYAASKDDPFRIGYDSSKTPRSKDVTFGVTIGF
ncbi:SusC/RagA family TonB-linked outer membrane protein [Dysgonomonas sp. 216]|uniref:SusC/RagA family TonB-linked outer membrane protein n=1 Tax=Dysgonomonas sp. 216 TaxID=2302934 RepID=UPI0013D7CA55|nr:SusC/RagA family TonB-linked outer membrane protein [Dysgonomonas sp. 216]NDW18955.1 SusC/RagA family TonB-linked outer membrane protein [Dysgonomonas sp. 216]